jgi:hypothetical protein
MKAERAVRRRQRCWVVRDRNGDTGTVHTTFVEQ